MIQLCKLVLKNYCGYKKFEKKFKRNDVIPPWIILYGPNGIGKSNLLNAIEMLSNPWRYKHNTSGVFFRKLTYSDNYNPSYEGFDNKLTDLYMEAIFSINGQDKKVIIENHWKKKLEYSEIYEKEIITARQDEEKSGIIVDELSNSVSNYINADNQIDIQRFQLKSEYKNLFLEMAKIIYGFDCELPENSLVEGVINREEQKKENLFFYTDFVLNKFNTKVHFKRFSAGEKKIATMLRKLFNDVYDYNSKKILLIDNITMHVYFDRHLKMIKKIKECFPDNQIITTTHSPEIIKKMPKEYLIDMYKELKNNN